MENVYFDPKTGYTGVNTFTSKAKITKKKALEWLETQPTYTLHKPARKLFKRNKVLTSRIDEYWQLDLADLSSLHKFNNGNKFLLNCIDVFSKFAWSIPVKSKNAESILNAFKSILKSTKRRPEMIQTDAGTEFTNKKFQALLKENNVEFFTVASELKASVVERFNRTLKEKMWKYFTKHNTYRYADILQDLMYNYNHSVHRTIGIEPAKVNSSNETQILLRAYKVPDRKTVVFKYNVGDKVRISKVKGIFEKGYIPNWSEETFIIDKRLARTPPVYVLKDQLGEELKGIFYEPELQKVNKIDDVYIIEKILKQRKRGNKTEYFVKWRGYGNKFNSWVSDLIKL